MATSHETVDILLENIPKPVLLIIPARMAKVPRGAHLPGGAAVPQEPLADQPGRG